MVGVFKVYGLQRGRGMGFVVIGLGGGVSGLAGNSLVWPAVGD